MSDPSSTSASVLLPAATVGLYVLDEDTRDSVRALSSDWRFARVVFDIHSGDIESAISAYEEKKSPDLLLVETKNIGDDFTQRLEVLAGICSEDTSAVVIGPVNDVYLYRKLIQMGVSDYLVKPVSQETFADVIARSLLEKMGASNSTLIAFVGSKGGVGTSVLSQASATLLSVQQGQKTIILDAAGGWSYLSVAMGGDPLTTLSESARMAGSEDQDGFKRIISHPHEKLSVLASGADPLLLEAVSAEGFEVIVRKLMTSYPLVIVDLSGASNDIKRSVMHMAHQVIVVTTPTLPALRGAKTLLQEIKDVRGGSDQNLDLVINMSGMAQGFEIPESQIAVAMDKKFSLVIPFSPKIFSAAENQGKKLTDIHGSENILAGLASLLKAAVSGITLPKEAGKEKSGLLGGLLGKIKAK